MTPGNLASETDSAVEALLLKRNGQKKTVQDVFEVVVAMNHDRRADTLRLLSEIQCNRDLLDDHINSKLHWTPSEFREFMAGRDEIDEKATSAILGVESDLRADLAEVKENCANLHGRAPRRSGDRPGEDWGGCYSEEQGKQVWLMWLLGTAVGRVLVFVAGGAAMLALNRAFG